MRTTHATIMLLAVFTLPVIADDEASDSSDRKTTRQLLDRIEKLERRIAALESKQRAENPSDSPRSPHYTPAVPPRSQPYTQPRAPLKTQPSSPPRSPLPDGYQYPHQAPAPNAPVLPPGSKVPDNWQRFEFNGQSFYIVPVQASAETSR